MFKPPVRRIIQGSLAPIRFFVALTLLLFACLWAAPVKSDDIVLYGAGGPFADKRVAQALSYAVDWRSVWYAIGGEAGSRGAVVAYTATFESSAARYDPGSARKLLAEAGFPNGLAAPIHYIRVDAEVIEEMIASLEEAGFPTKPVEESSLNTIGAALNRAMEGKSPALFLLRRVADDEPQTATVPNILGLTPEGAEKNHADLEIRVRPIDRIESPRRPGTIIEQIQVSGSPMPENRIIEVILSAGEFVPDLRGVTLPRAQQDHQRLKIVEGPDPRIESSRPLGTILRQRPAPGSPMPEGRTIEVVLSAGEVVPDLRGVSLTRAQQDHQRLKILEGPDPRIESSRPIGTILRQRPAPGSPMPENRTIEVVLSAGEFVPDLRGMMLVDARQEHQRLKVVEGPGGKIESTQSPGTIVRQRPAPGLSMPANRLIEVTLSTGESVPDLRGMTLSVAKRDHPRLRIVEAPGNAVESDQPEGTIVDQRPAPKSPIPAGRSIEVVLSAGLVLAPNIRGMTPATAEREHIDLDLDVEVIGEAPSVEPYGTIVEQSPQAGVPMPTDRMIRVVLSGGIPTPNLLGMTRDQAARRYASLDLGLEIGGRDPSLEPLETIVDQDPDAGTLLPADHLIVIRLSSGPVMPDLRRLTPASATSRHAGLGLSLQKVDEVDSEAPAGTIVSHEPSAGDPIPGNRVVYVVLAATPLPPWIWIGVGAIAVVVIIGTARLLRPRQPTSPPKPHFFTTRAQSDPGQQEVEKEGTALGGPAIRVRPFKDRGTQEIIEPISDEED